MDQGACGFSTGLVYEPGRYSETDEIVELAMESAAQAAGSTPRTCETRVTSCSTPSTRRFTSAGRRDFRCRSHITSRPARRNWGKIGQSLAKVDEANASGADVTLDVYPYTAGSGPMAQYFDIDNIDPELAEVIRFASCPAFLEYEGRMAVDVANEQGISVTQLIHDVIVAPEGDRTLCILFIIGEADVEENLRHPLMMVGSDGIPDLRVRPHPRLFGTFPRVLGDYVRQRGVIGLEDAIRRMTSLSCDRFGLADRGRVAEGQYADLVVFDPATVIDTATYDDPKQEPEGIDLVVVNGAVALRDGSHTGIGSGRMLSYQR